MMETAEVVIVGGGVMGCSLAYQLARRGVEVTLLERDQLGSGSTAKCAGGVRQQFSSEVNVRIQSLSVRLLEGFEAELGSPAGLRQVGYLFVLTRSADVQAFGDLVPMWHRLGVRGAGWISPEEAGRLVPILNLEDVLGCTFCPSDGLAGPADVTSGYAAAARRHGARVLEGVEVIGIEVSKGRVSAVRTAAGEIATRAIFDCAGPWAAAVGEMAGADVPVRPYRRHVVVTDRFPELPGGSPMTVDFASSFYFHPEGEGVLLGMSDRDEPSTYQTDVSWDFVERIVAQATMRAPALERASIRTAWAGLYETTPDNQAILGPVKAVEGFWCACGFSGHGFMQAPAAGLLLAQRLVDGVSEIDLSPLGHDRFAAGRLVPERNVF